MSNLLYVVKSQRMYSQELHPTCLYIYDDYMVYVKRGLIKRNEATISYNHVSQVYLKKGLIASTLEIINTGGVENITVEWLKKKEAAKAKSLIDQKVFHTHAKVTGKNQKEHSDIPGFEAKLARLKELKLKGVLNEREFEKERKKMLKSV